MEHSVIAAGDGGVSDFRTETKLEFSPLKTRMVSIRVFI
jgi:hypothetical protein